MKLRARSCAEFCSFLRIPRAIVFAPANRNKRNVREWIHSVLGGIPEHEIAPAATMLTRAIEPGGLLFLSETTASPGTPRGWHVRGRDQLQSLFPVGLRHVVSSHDAGDENSVLRGRRIQER